MTATAHSFDHAEPQPQAESPPLAPGRLITIPAKPRATPAPGQMRMLSRAILLEERPPPRFVATTVLLISLIIVGALVWASVSMVSSTASAPGQVVPTGSVRAVQHLEGGIVDAVAVGEGDLVEQGQVLVSLDSTVVLADLEQYRSRQATLQLRSTRLTAQLDGTAPAFGALVERYPGLAADQQGVFDSEQRAAEDQRSVLRSQIDQREIEVVLAAERVTSLESQITVLDEQVAIRQELFNRGVGSRIVLLDTQREASRLRGDLAEAQVAARQAAVAVMEAERMLAEFETERRRTATAELSEVNADLSEINETITALQDRLDRLDVTAPVRGIVNGLEVSTPGAVIDSGQVILTIVPQDEQVVIETRIEPGDVGFIQVGQEADVIVDGFPVSRYGSVPGAVGRISATSFEDQEGARYYQARVVLDQDYLEFNGARHHLQPGMTTTVSITTGSQTILDYLLRPVFDSLRRSFSER